jgi:hypothetical protein
MTERKPGFGWTTFECHKAPICFSSLSKEKEAKQNRSNRILEAMFIGVKWGCITSYFDFAFAVSHKSYHIRALQSKMYTMRQVTTIVGTGTFFVSATGALSCRCLSKKA